METDPTTLLRKASLRVTRPRVAVLNALRAHPHATADSVAASVREELGSVSTQAVYDVLKALTAAHLVRRIETAGPAIFEPASNRDHHHAICRGCGAIQDVECARPTQCASPATPVDGFMIETVDVTYWGTCPGCSTAPSTPR